MYLPKIGLRSNEQVTRKYKKSAKYKLAEICVHHLMLQYFMNKMPFVDYIFVFKTCLGSAENASCLDIAFLGLCHFAGSAFIEHVK